MIDIDASAMMKLERKLKSYPKAIPKILSESLNRGLVSGRAKAATQARKVYSVKARTLKQGVRLSKAKPTYLYAFAHFKGGTLPLGEFRTSFVRRRQNLRTGKWRAGYLRATVKDRKTVKMSHAFQINTSNKRLVGERPRENTKEIHWMYGPSVPQMMGETRVIDAFNKNARSTIVKRIEHGIAKTLEGAFGK